MKNKLPNKPKCPQCQTTLDGYTGVTDPEAIPKENDLSLCGYCATLLTYTKELNLVKVSKALFNSLPEETQHEINMASKAARIMGNR